jgi:hypothetical protein
MNESSLYKAHVDMYSHLVSNRLIFSKSIFKKFMYCYTLSIYLYTFLCFPLVHYMRSVSETFQYTNLAFVIFQSIFTFRAPVKSLPPPDRPARVTSLSLSPCLSYPIFRPQAGALPLLPPMGGQR